MIQDKNSFLTGVYAGSKLSNNFHGEQEIVDRGFIAKANRSILSGNDFVHYLQHFAKVDPVKGQQLLMSLGINDKMIITHVYNYGHCGGLYFNADGRLTLVIVDAQYDWTDDRDLGIYNVKDKQILASTFPYISTSNSYGTHYPIFWSKEYADKVISKSSPAAAFRWDVPWELNSNGTLDMECTPFWKRYGSGGSWSAGYGYNWSTSSGFGSFENTSFHYIDEDTVKFLF